ncbi:hypothetical protein ISS07_02675 [Candidatus Woesearchaeota archaeon]|nr:hypothetical protein [Candidatus Woesearchaeota archaeon]
MKKDFGSGIRLSNSEVMSIILGEMRRQELGFKDTPQKEVDAKYEETSTTQKYHSMLLQDNRVGWNTMSPSYSAKKGTIAPQEQHWTNQGKYH